jgi:hypothetical protein
MEVEVAESMEGVLVTIASDGTGINDLLIC